MNPASMLAQNTDERLPSHIAIASNNWFTLARNYAIFSRAWYRYRSRPILVLISICLALLFIGVSMSEEGWRMGVVVDASSGWYLLCGSLLGPWLAVQVLQRQWSPCIERVALIASIVVGICLAWGAASSVGTAVRQVLIGEARTRVELALSSGVDRSSGAASVDKSLNARPSVSVSAPPTLPDDAKPKTEAPKSLASFMQALVIAISVLFTSWLGGGFDLILFFNQRRRMQAALHEQALARAQAARSEAELRLSVLAAQVEPHFLFNTLAGVRSAILSDPVRATTIVDLLVDYLRATIPKFRSDGGSAQARLDAQIEIARAYLALIHARIPRLTYTIDIADGLAAMPVPPLILISLVENAVKHGIEPKIGPGHITVQAQRIDDAQGAALEISVVDNGVGFSVSTTGSGIGLANIHERLAALYGTQASLSLKSLERGGVRAAIRLPIVAETDRRLVGAELGD